MDSAEYLPWCQKIDESKKLIAELKDYIDSLKQEDAVAEEAFVDVDVPAEEPEAPAEEAPEAPAEEPKAEEAPAEAPKAGAEIQIDTTNNEEQEMTSKGAPARGSAFCKRSMGADKASLV